MILKVAARLPKDGGDTLILALGCTLLGDGRTASPHTIAVAHKAAELYNQLGEDGDPWVIFVGKGYKPGQVPGVEADLMEEAVGNSIPQDRLLKERWSFNTPMNALATFLSVYGRSWGRIVLIAADGHNPRAAFTFGLIWRALGWKGPPIEAVSARSAGYTKENSSKYFLQSPFWWRIWNILGYSVAVVYAGRLWIRSITAGIKGMSYGQFLATIPEIKKG